MVKHENGELHAPETFQAAELEEATIPKSVSYRLHREMKINLDRDGSEIGETETDQRKGLIPFSEVCIHPLLRWNAYVKILY